MVQAMKSPTRYSIVMTLAAVLLAAPRAGAQQAAPSISYVYPAGAQRGTTVQVTIGGQRLGRVTDVPIWGSGVKAAAIQTPRPIAQRDVEELRTQLQTLTRQGGGKGSKPTDMTAEERGQARQIAETLAAFARRREAPALGETLTLEITVDADAAPGPRELRVQTPQGLSNPLVFCVGSLKEANALPARASEVLAATGSIKFPRMRKWLPPAKGTTDVALPVVLNGQIIPGEVDRYAFDASKGQRIVVAVAARELVPYLADAVPGWFDPAVAIYDAQGNELAWADDDRFRPDPVLCCQIPADGRYFLDIRDALYRGREDFVYRAAVGELPLITSVFPLGGQAAAQTPMQWQGWNLPTVSPPADEQPGLHPIAQSVQEIGAAHLLFATDTLPECMEQPPTDSSVPLARRAQNVTLPIVVNGHIQQPGEWDVYGFHGRAGQQVVAEVQARRLGSPMDSVLRLTDAEGKTLALNDDFADPLSGLVTHQADSLLSVALPADGLYYVQLADVQGKAGDAYAYRLRISGPRPDFGLLVTPSAVSIRGGAAMPITVTAVRRDGFAGAIPLSLNGAPKGFSLAGGLIPAGQDKIRVTVTAPTTSEDGPMVVRLEGRAEIGGQQVVRRALAAEDMMQAFGYQHLVPVGDLKLCVTEPRRLRWLRQSSWIAAGDSPLTIPAGGTASMEVSLPAGSAGGQISLDLSDPPPGVTMETVTGEGRIRQLLFRADGQAAKPGLQGNLIVNVLMEQAPQGNDKGKSKPRRISVGTLPALAFQVR